MVRLTDVEEKNIAIKINLIRTGYIGTGGGDST